MFILLTKDSTILSVFVAHFLKSSFKSILFFMQERLLCNTLKDTSMVVTMAPPCGKTHAMIPNAISIYSSPSHLYQQTNRAQYPGNLCQEC